MIFLKVIIIVDWGVFLEKEGFFLFFRVSEDLTVWVSGRRDLVKGCGV